VATRIYWYLVGSTKLLARPAAKSSKRILIADNLAQMRKLIRAYLEEEREFRVCGEAIDGFDVIDKAQNLKPDLIILEVSMPRMSGLEAAQKLKTLLPQTPIIAFTSYESMMGCFDAREIGVDAVLPKDRGISLLKESVTALLKRQVPERLQVRRGRR
jgi:DNA-binding NarL/FixJ family response regulator